MQFLMIIVKYCCSLKRSKKWKMTNMNIYIKYFTHPYVIPDLSAVDIFSKELHFCFLKNFFFVWYSGIYYLYVALSSKNVF